MTELLALIFDVDGTLADTERAHLDAFNRAFAHAGLDWHWSADLYNELLAVTGGKERIGHYMDRYLEGQQERSGRDAFIAALHADKTRYYVEAMSQGHLNLRPGVERLIREVRAAGLRLAIATTTTPDNVFALLENTLGAEARTWFDVIGAGGVVPNKKPAPDIYHYVLEALGLAPAQCLAFEDSAPGLAASRAAGLATVVTVNAFTRDQDFTHAALVLDSFGEPDAPFTVLAGDAGDKTYMDVELARQVHARAALG